jgi:hypothetical protein
VQPSDYSGKWSAAPPESSGRRMLANVRARRQAGEDHAQPFPTPTTVCRSRKLDLTALGRSTVRFSDSAHAACGALRRASFIHNTDPNQRSNLVVSLRLRDRHVPRRRNGSSQESAME